MAEKDPKHDARFYVHEAGMSARPEYYSGRGPKTGDLNGRMLEKIHGLVTKHGGEKAAEAFVAMVADLKSGAATTFLNGLYALERMEWKWKDVDPSAAGTDREWDLGNSHGEERNAVAFMTVVDTLARAESSGQWEDRAVRGGFLESHRYTQDQNGRWRKLKDGETTRRNTYSYGGY